MDLAVAAHGLAVEPEGLGDHLDLHSFVVQGMRRGMSLASLVRVAYVHGCELARLTSLPGLHQAAGAAVVAIFEGAGYRTCPGQATSSG
ncbi:hypothetical protein [Streptomyces sp. NPDC005533]|uniref:hypothetical protein n=1 Tax=Streptomyces sp. NPDC005533 TaxID=3364723 RepID=UPI003695813F